MGKFVHLHLHTEYSLLDGLSKIPKLLTRVKEMDMDSVAITDHGTMYGAIDFYKKAKQENIKPIIGVEAYTVDYDHKEKPDKERFNYNHLLLLSKNEEGYKNLMKLTSIAHLEGYYYRPRFHRELLAKYSKGIIASSACVNGEVPQAIIAGDYKKAKTIAKWFYDLFGKDYYLEIQRHEYDKYVNAAPAEMKEELRNQAKIEKLVNEGIVKLSRDLGIALIATNDAHYINKEDASAQDVLVCVATGKHVSETKRIRMIDTPTYYARPYEEMSALFPDFPDALENTVKIAEKCELEISTLGKWFFPKFPLPNNEKSDTYLVKLANKKLKEKFGNPDKELQERLDHELGIINQKGYAPYFLIDMDLANWTKSQGIITNTRGSAAGSLVSYVLGITTVNPITYYLPFERFLNPYRPSPPDIDFDVADDKRDEIIGYITKKYGAEKVAQVCTFGRMLARAAVRDVARVLGYEYSVGDRISKMIPPPKQGFPVNVEKAFILNPSLKEAYDNDEDTKKILDLAKQVEGSARHISVHAAGVVVAPTEMTDFSPIQREPNGEKIITQYEMHAAEDVGLIKFDILGIRNLSILGLAVKIVEEREKIKVDLHEIPIDDKKTFQMLARGETMGVFQMGSAGMTKYIKELKPNKVEDLMAMVALYRPGPIAVIPEYIERKNNPKLVKYLDPRMEKFLGASYGLIVYQDDLLFCALDLAGYTWEEADKFRKAVGKKIPEEMAAQKEKFEKGIVANGQTQEFAESLWKLFEPFQAYGFNKCVVGNTEIVDAKTGRMIKVSDLAKEKNKDFEILSCDINSLKLKKSHLTKVWKNGIKKVYKIKTQLGYEITATANHPFYTINGWTNLEDLKIGDKVATARSIKIKSAKKWPNHEVIVLGHLLAEGNLCHPSGPYYYTTDDKQWNDYVINLNKFPNTVAHTHTRRQNSHDVYGKRIDISKPNGAIEWLKHLGLRFKDSHSKFIPSAVFELSDEQIALLISRMWEGDGNINSKDKMAYYATSSKIMAHQLQSLLLRLGIINRVREVLFKYKEGRIGYQVHIINQKNIKRFAETVGVHFADKTRLEKLKKMINDSQEYLSSRDTIPSEVRNIVRLEKNRKQLTWDKVQTKAGVSKSEFQRLGNSLKLGFRHETINKLAIFFDSSELKRLTKNDTYWDRIVSIKYVGREETYDLTVPDTHTFIANNFIVHNSHAASYGMVVYQTAYMKANYPVEYMTALLTCESGDKVKVSEAINECRRMEIEVLSPDINKSDVGFTIEKNSIRFGLSAIKNVGHAAIEAILDARRAGEFNSLFDFLERVDARRVNKRVLESLVKVGALSKFGKRAAILSSIDEIKAKIKPKKAAAQTGLFGDEIIEKRADTNEILANIEEFSETELQNLERQLLGFSLSAKPTHEIIGDLANYATHKTNEVTTEGHFPENIKIAGIISEIRVVVTKKTQAQMAFAKIEDEKGVINAVVFPKIFKDKQELWVENQVVLLSGKVDFRDDEANLLVETADDLKSIKTKKNAFFIKIPVSTSVDDLKSLKKLLLAHPGPDAVTLTFAGKDKKISLPFGISWSKNLSRKVDALLSS